MKATTLSAIRALAWKEWREQRMVLVTGLAVSLLLPVLYLAMRIAVIGAPEEAGGATALLALVAMLIWPLFALLTGAGTFAGERAEGTLPFLLTRPVSRLTLWCMKITSAAAVLAGIVCGTGLIAWMFLILEGTNARVEDVLFTIDYAPVISLGALPIFFAMACFFSTLLPRPLTAAGAGFVGAVVLGGGVVLLWSRLDLRPQEEPILLLGHLAATTCLVLGASWIAFRGRDGGGLRHAALIGGGLVAACLALAFPMVAVLSHLPLESATVRAWDTAPDGSAIAVTAERDEGNSPRIWLVRTDGTGIARLTPRLTRQPSFSPDGKWIAYWSRRSWCGLAAPAYHLRLVRPDGTQDHRVAGGVEQRNEWSPLPGPFFSPDSTEVAWLHAGNLVIAPVDDAAVGDGRVRTRALGGTPFDGGSLEGWTAEGEGIVLVSSRDLGTIQVAVYLPAADRLRVVGEIDGRRAWWRPDGSEDAGLTHLPLLVEGEKEWADLVLVDLATGAVEPIGSSVCPMVSFTRSGRGLAWGVCEGDGVAGYHATLKTRDLDTGATRTLVTLDSRLGFLTPSPDGRRVALPLRREETPPQSTLVWGVAQEGETTELPAGWVPVGWSGRSRLLVQRGFGAPALAVMDLETGAWHDLLG